MPTGRRASVHYSQDSSLIYCSTAPCGGAGAPWGRQGLGSGPDSLSDHFTLSFWMKHCVTPNKGKKEEETIVCNTVQNGEPSSGHLSKCGEDWSGPASNTVQSGGRGRVISLSFVCKIAVLPLTVQAGRAEILLLSA